ncbi:hypothetical protein AeRB84_000378 [Aphanomyces euteiches]|nr:hypothetical protein AeRB84_000378 [Aphanomyces euteiches]
MRLQLTLRIVDFAYVKACKEIERLNFGGEWKIGMNMFDNSVKLREKYRYLNSIIDFDSYETIRALGVVALSIFLTIENIGNQLDDCPEIHVTAVQLCSFDDAMFIDSNSLKALQIFSEEHHPSQVKSWEKSKEGFSVFALLDNTYTKSGRNVLRQWLLRPLLQKSSIENRQDVIEFFTTSQEDLCSKCRELDERFGDMHGYILDIQHQYLSELTKAVLEQEHQLLDMLQLVSELDCYLSLSSCAQNFNFVRPAISEDAILLAKDARHPLQELTVETYIPNDITLSADSGLIKLITGQNGSGKSVFLKMVGVVQILAQIGSFVPASQARIGIINKLFTRLLSLETATLCQSSFSMDCNQVATMMNHGDSKSLMLIDEFGKGTSQTDGVCLLTSVLRELKARVKHFGGPRVVLTTHFLELFREPKLSMALGLDFSKLNNDSLTYHNAESTPLSCYVMSSVESSDENAPTSSALYELRPGIATSSRAIQCASSAGA